MSLRALAPRRSVLDVTGDARREDSNGRERDMTKRNETGLRLMFAYGANTNTQSMDWRCPKAVDLGAATLPGFSFEFRVHADVVEREGARVRGVLWAITPECEASLDSFEGFPTYYVKREVRVWWRGAHVPAFVYVMAEHVERGLTYPSRGYERTLRAGYAEHGIEAAQIDKALARARRAEQAEAEQGWLDFAGMES